MKRAAFVMSAIVACCSTAAFSSVIDPDWSGWVWTSEGGDQLFVPYDGAGGTFEYYYHNYPDDMLGYVDLMLSPERVRYRGSDVIRATMWIADPFYDFEMEDGRICHVESFNASFYDFNIVDWALSSGYWDWDWEGRDEAGSACSPESYSEGYDGTVTGVWTEIGDVPHSVMLFGPAPIPLPASLPLLGLGVGILSALGWRRRNSVGKDGPAAA